MSATTPRSWVMSTIAMPSRSRSERRTSSTPAWIVTSSAVVGSSAIRTFGSQAIPIAITTRWRIPPESWCGYSSTRWPGAGMPTDARSSTVRSRASRRFSPRCMRSTSPTWHPTVSTGFSELIGSWKIIEISRPRISRRRAGELASRSSEPNPARPVTTAPGPSRPSSDIAVTLLPQPDSPTIASTSPRSRPKDTRSTACTAPSSPPKRTERSLTSRSAISGRSAGRGRRAARRRTG
jgi:hypothetical protein